MTAPIRPRSGRPTLGRLLVIDGVNYTALAWAVLALALSILVYRVFGFKYGFPEAISTRIDFIYWINIGEDWLKANVRDTTRAVAKVITYWIGEVEYFLQVRPWPLVVVALGLLGLRFGGLRLALLTVVGYQTVNGPWAEVEGVKATKEGYIAPAVFAILNAAVLFTGAEQLYA